MIVSTFLYLLFFIGFSYQLNNGLGRTPQMGKNRKRNTNSFEEKSDVHLSLLKDGIVGIIFVVISMKR